MEDLSGVLYLSGVGDAEVELPRGVSKMNFAVSSVPGMPVSSSNSQDGNEVVVEYRLLRRWHQRRWVAFVAWALVTPQVLNYSAE